jgi:hypothetical protein
MTELSEKQARLAALKKARDSGVLSVRHGEDGTTFRSLAELNSIISALESEISGLVDTTAAPRRVRYLYQSGKGL